MGTVAGGALSLVPRESPTAEASLKALGSSFELDALATTPLGRAAAPYQTPAVSSYPHSLLARTLPMQGASPSSPLI